VRNFKCGFAKNMRIVQVTQQVIATESANLVMDAMEAAKENITGQLKELQ